jgi:nucleoside-diphosphate-sugar epimerase
MLLIIDKVNNYTVLNIASGKGITIKEVLNIILKIQKAENLKIKFDQSMPTMIPKRLINIEKAKKNINFNPKISLEEGLNKTISWYKSNDNN